MFSFKACIHLAISPLWDDLTIILGADECTCECTSNLDPSLEGCRVATAIEIDPLQAMCSSSRFRSACQHSFCHDHLYIQRLTIAQGSILQHEPPRSPAASIVDPFAQEAFHIRWFTVTLCLNHVFLVLDCYQHTVQRHSLLPDHRRHRRSCHQGHLSGSGIRL